VQCHTLSLWGTVSQHTTWMHQPTLMQLETAHDHRTNHKEATAAIGAVIVATQSVEQQHQQAAIAFKAW